MGNQTKNRQSNKVYRDSGEIVMTNYSPNLISTIKNAIRLDKVVSFEYSSREKGITKRDIEPMDIIYRHGTKHLVGWCRLRNDWRTFRLDRIVWIAVQLENSFEPREDYKKEDFEDNSKPKHKEEKEVSEDSLPYSTGFGKTMSQNKLNFDKNEEVKKYSEDEEDLAM